MIQDLSSLTLEQRVGQLFFIGIEGPVIDEPTRELLHEVSPGGVCLFARNIREAGQTRDLLDGLRNNLPITPFLSVDQEGGLVDRLRRVMTPMPAASKLKTAADAAELGRIVAESLRILGFNMDFAPVVDVIDTGRAERKNGLFSREFGRSPAEVVDFAGAFLKQLEKGGISGCLKHFPGLGAAGVDSHEELPNIEITAEEFEATDLYPYRQLLKTRGVGAVVAAHAAYPRSNLQETGQNGKLLPASLSSGFITNLLRGELAFDGLVVTDDLEMGAILRNYGMHDACKMAVLAGVDMLAICAEPEKILQGYSAVLKAVQTGEIAEDRLEESINRIAEAKTRLSEPLQFDTSRIEQLSNEVAELSGRLA